MEPLDLDTYVKEEQKDLETLAYLCRSLRHEKQAEEKLKAQRILTEEKIAKLVPGPERGQKTVKLSDGSSVTVERGFNYKADVEGITSAFAPEWRPLKTKTTIDLDATTYEKYRSENPEFFSEVSKFVVAIPKKVAVSLKEKK